MTFSSQPFSVREGTLGDIAEGKFEEYAAQVLKRNVERWGLCRPSISLAKIPARIRYAPDYLMSGKFVECQGFGRDQQLKLKLDKWGALHWWNDVLPVEMFVYDSHRDRHTMLTLDALDALVNHQDATLRTFPEGKSYFSFPASLIFDV